MEPSTVRSDTLPFRGAIFNSRLFNNSGFPNFIPAYFSGMAAVSLTGSRVSVSERSDYSPRVEGWTRFTQLASCCSFRTSLLIKTSDSCKGLITALNLNLKKSVADRPRRLESLTQQKSSLNLVVANLLVAALFAAVCLQPCSLPKTSPQRSRVITRSLSGSILL